MFSRCLSLLIHLPLPPRYSDSVRQHILSLTLPQGAEGGGGLLCISFSRKHIHDANSAARSPPLHLRRGLKEEGGRKRTGEEKQPPAGGTAAAGGAQPPPPAAAGAALRSCRLAPHGSRRHGVGSGRGAAAEPPAPAPNFSPCRRCALVPVGFAPGAWGVC